MRALAYLPLVAEFTQIYASTFVVEAPEVRPQLSKKKRRGNKATKEASTPVNKSVTASITDFLGGG